MSKSDPDIKILKKQLQGTKMKRSDSKDDLKVTSASARTSLMTFEKIDQTFVAPNETGNYIVIPPDGGWGWVIVVATFLTFTFVDGLSYCFGLFMEDIATEYKVSTTMVSITSSLLTAETYLFGPIFCAMINRYNFRLVGVIGGIGASVCVFCASFAPNFWVFILLMGVMEGMFLSMAYITGCIIVGFYFDKWRALATAISVSGSATGVVVFPLIVGFLSDSTWRVQLRVISGILTITIFAAITYKSITPVLVKTVSDGNFEKRLSMLERLNAEEEDNSGEITTKSSSSNVWQMRKNKIHNMRYPTAADVNTGGTVIISHICPAEFQMMKSRNVSMISEFNRMDEDVKKKGCFVNCNLCLKKLRREKTTMYIATRPLYREDIFFHGPLKRLDKYKSALAEQPNDSKVTNYHMEVTRLAAYQDYLDQYSVKCLCCPHAVLRILFTMFDMNLLRNHSFTIFMFSGFFTAAGMFIPFIYVKDMNVAAGLGEKTSRNLLCAIGFTNIIGRMLCGVVSIYPKIRAIIVMEVGLIISGIAIILLPFFPNVYLQYACGSLFGLTIAVNGALRPIVIVDLYGLENLTNAFGIAVLFQGVACATGIPIAGVLKDVTGTYHAVMIFAGSCLTFSGLLIFLVQPLVKREKNAEFSKAFAYRMAQAQRTSKAMVAAEAAIKEGVGEHAV